MIDTDNHRSDEDNAHKITEIEGTITTADGETREFSITAEMWSQWGAGGYTLGRTVDALTLMHEALGVADHFHDEAEAEAEAEAEGDDNNDDD